MSSKWDSGPRLGGEPPPTDPDDYAAAQIAKLDGKVTKARPRFGRIGKQGVRARGRTRSKRDGSMNDTERKYAAELDRMVAEGRVARWDFEAVKFRLADNTWYTPDFRVLMADGTEEIHEVKGHWEPAARVRFKVAAEVHPYVFVASSRPRRKKLAKAKVQSAGWAFEVLGGDSGVVAAFLASGAGELFAGEAPDVAE